MKSDTSVCLQESEGSNSDLREPVNKIKMIGTLDKKHPNNYNVYSVKGISPTIPSCGDGNMGRGVYPFISVSDNQKSTNTQTKFLNTNSQTLRTGETVPKSTQKIYQTLICCVEDFLAKHSQSLENGEDLKTLEVQCFLKLREYLKLKDLKLYSLKTSRAYSITPKGRLLESSFKRWMNWGMRFNGWYLTANFSEFPKTERGYSLSEILEENVDQKYYLSEEIRSMTTIEYERLQGFPDNWTKYGINEMGKKIKMSNTQRHRQIGNAVTTNVIAVLGKQISDANGGLDE